MHLLVALLVFADTPMAKKPKPPVPWRVLLADHAGAYWVDSRTGKVTPDPTRRRGKPAPVKLDPRSQLRTPPPARKRYRNRSMSKANGVTARLLKNKIRVETKEGKQWITKVGEGVFPVLRPDGKALAYFRWSKATSTGKSRKANVVIRDLETGKERAVVTDAHLSDMSWSPDGRTLAVGTHGALLLVDVQTGKQHDRRALPDIDKRLYAHGPYGLVWSPDGRELAARFSFLGGRAAAADGSFEEIYGDRELFLLNLITKKLRVHRLPKGTCEGPILGEKLPAKR